MLWLTFCEHKNFVLQFSGRQFFADFFKVHLTSENKKTVVMRCTLPYKNTIMGPIIVKLKWLFAAGFGDVFAGVGQGRRGWLGRLAREVNWPAWIN